MKKVLSALLPEDERDRAADSFTNEMHFQSRRLVPVLFIASFIFLLRIGHDRAAYPELEIIPLLRAIFPLVGILMLVMTRIAFFHSHAQYLLLIPGVYLQVFVALAAGLTQADPIYVFVYLFALVMMSVVPVERKYSISILGLTLVVFYSTCWYVGVDTTNPVTMYMLTAAPPCTFMVLLVILMLNNIRQKNWKLSWAYQTEAEERISQAERENQAKSQFYTTLSHEIRTPMNGVVGMAEMLMTTELSVQQKQYADVITNSGKSLLAIINDTLDHAKISSGNINLESENFDLDRLCIDVASMFSLTAEKKNLHFLVDIGSATPVLLKGDANRIRQILINLVGNAFKFTTQGSISLRVSDESREDEAGIEQGIKLKFEVIDTGIGITPEQSNRLFLPFQQAEDSTARQYGGTGLGLSISKSLAKLMGGEAGAYGESGMGSTFWFTLRVDLADQEYASSAQEKQEILAKKRILFIERSTDFARSASDHCNSWEMNIDMTHAGVDGMARCIRAISDDDPYDIVCIDAKVQDYHGAGLARAINSITKNQKTCIMLLDGTDICITPEMGIALSMKKPSSAKMLKDPFINLISNDTQANKLESQLQEEARLYGMSVLVAEDNTVNQLVIKQMLKKLNIVCDLAEDGQQALELYRSTPDKWDLIFMDCEMPILDGFKATRAIRDFERESELPSTPIVALSAHVLKEQRDLCASAGMDDYLAKPLELRILREKLLEFHPPGDSTLSSEATGIPRARSNSA